MPRRRIQTIASTHSRQSPRTCVCGCSLPVAGKTVLASQTCRKRYQRQRQAAELAKFNVSTQDEIRIHNTKTIRLFQEGKITFAEYQSRIIYDQNCTRSIT